MVAPVALHDVDAHGDRLVGLVGDDDALADLRAAGAVLGRVVGLDRGLALAQLGLLGLQARAVATPLGGGVRTALLALGVALLGGALRALRGGALGPAGLELLAARLRSGLGLGRRSFLRGGLGRLSLGGLGRLGRLFGCLFGGLSQLKFCLAGSSSGSSAVP